MLSKNFFLAGQAIFTVSNNKGVHYTFRINAEDSKFDTGKVYFAKLLTRANHYIYIGKVVPTASGLDVVATHKSQPGHELARKVLQWALNAARVPEGYGIQHESRCGRCGRPLTHPTSIETGLGPECAKVS